MRKMILNMIAYISAIVITVCLFVIAAKISISESPSCELLLAQNVIYALTTVTYFLRVSASCYMNLQYSRPFDECKK